MLIDGYLRRHLRRTRKLYSERHRIVTDFTNRTLSDGLLEPSSVSNAGLHVAQLLPTGSDDEDLRQRARDAGILLGNWAECWAGFAAPPGIIGFGAVFVPDLTDALGTLAGLLAVSQRS